MKNTIIFSVLVLFAQTVFAKSSCETAETMTRELNEKTIEFCSAGLTWDLSGFVPDGSICESRQQGLNLILRVFQDFCPAHKKELLAKVAIVRVEAALIQEAEYKLENRALVARVPIKEAAVLSKWNEETDKLKKFLKTSTGLNLSTSQEKEKLKKEMEIAETKSAELQKDLAREKKQKARQEKIKLASEKLKRAGENYAARIKEIWSRAGNDQAAIQKKTEDAAAAQKEFEAAQAEVDVMKRAID